MKAEMKILLILTLPVLLVACVTMHGTYRLRAVDEQGQDQNPNVVMMAEGRGIYSSRIALCATYPESTILIEDQAGLPLKGESGRKCRKR